MLKRVRIAGWNGWGGWVGMGVCVHVREIRERREKEEKIKERREEGRGVRRKSGSYVIWALNSYFNTF